MANKTLSDFPVLANLDAASVAHVQKELVDYQVPLNTLTKYVTDNAEYADMGNKIDGATEKTTPVDADMVGLMDSAASKVLKKLSWANIKATLKAYFDLLYPSADGWISPNETWTYAGADAPTFTFTVAADVTTKYCAGMRLKLTQTTVKYFIITAVSAYTGGNTTITVYGGTDYTLANAAITSPYYSRAKAPFGFPLSSEKWTVEVTDTSNRSQASPSQNTWYNLGSLSISIPIGAWRVCYDVFLGATKATSTVAAYSTLSTANNSETDNQMTGDINGYGTAAASIYKEKSLLLEAKASYYLNSRTIVASATSLDNYNASITATIRAICAYL